MIAFELLLTVPFFGIMGALTMWLTGMRPLRISVLTIFVLAAHVGVLAFIVAYGLVFGDADIGFSGVRTIVGLLLGMPIAGIVSGWLAARWFSARAGSSD